MFDSKSKTDVWYCDELGVLVLSTELVHRSVETTFDDSELDDVEIKCIVNTEKAIVYHVKVNLNKERWLDYVYHFRRIALWNRSVNLIEVYD